MDFDIQTVRIVCFWLGPAVLKFSLLKLNFIYLIFV